MGKLAKVFQNRAFLDRIIFCRAGPLALPRQEAITHAQSNRKPIIRDESITGIQPRFHGTSGYA
jgi:hypothetical protein